MSLSSKCVRKAVVLAVYLLTVAKAPRQLPRQHQQLPQHHHQEPRQIGRRRWISTTSTDACTACRISRGTQISRPRRRHGRTRVSGSIRDHQQVRTWHGVLPAKLQRHPPLIGTVRSKTATTALCLPSLPTQATTRRLCGREAPNSAVARARPQ